ncbi:enoyl-CoA hydratase [Azomonas macrocytogenes]|uniref:Enoyl-CoA hydratase/carnithine racemase n=1 Tax=Azomonas macrocytogenes TaxID=69962 RepID=A0A839T827_AZOMA|nr:enoyl-CoA hydratase [Azomonas macrocytogenes]MBB3104404.1 enoyl-CoA hydratase/carnithine racemase [Azomonas macrocytogenes]
MAHAIEPYKAGVFDLPHKLTVETHGHTALITINQPPANNWDHDSLIGLRQVLEHLNRDDGVYALVISGHGEKFFSAGIDPKLFANGDRVYAWEIAQRLGKAFEALRDFRGISIAAINGFALGAGLECALACDVRIAERQVQLGFPEAAHGLMPCAGGIRLLPQLVGIGWAKRMLLCGERIDAETAVRIGLIEQQVDPGESRRHALLMAGRIARQSPMATQAIKLLLNANARENPGPAEREAFVALFDTEDAREGINAFLEQREPNWRNL